MHFEIKLCEKVDQCLQITANRKYFQLLSYFPQWLDLHVLFGTDFMPDVLPDATLPFIWVLDYKYNSL